MPIYKTGKVKDGKAQYRVIFNYTDSQGNKRRASRCVYGKTEAKDAEQELSAKAKQSAIPACMTVKQLFDEYMEAKKAEVRTSSYEKSKRTMEHDVLTEDIKNLRLDRLTVPALQKWKNQIAKRDVKITTKNNYIKEFNTMLNYAVRMEYIPKNPLKSVGRFKDAYFQTAEQKIRYYTPEEFKAYIQAAEADRKTMLDYACYIFFNIAYYTGMRKGEINALKWSDIEGDVIHVRRSITQKVKGKYEETPPKNESSYRTLKAPQKLVDLLATWKSIQIEKLDGGENSRVCGCDRPLSDTNIENHNKRYAELAGLPHRTIHEFRHSHASVLINGGINPLEVARRLGHADVKMTLNTYSHWFPSAEEKAVEILDTI